jgi:alkanesulfonate monooxygenase SsuD/methylene tetrahydromethanopterin reductase-like flavin-dependent oxidoreductase (luciferase family)
MMTVRDLRPAIARPSRIGIALGDRVLLDAQDGQAVRVQATDLRDAGHRTAAIWEASQTHVDVLVDIDVVIAHDAHTACELAEINGINQSRGSLLYIGTPRGLAGLLADIHAVGISDGAVLLPLQIPGVLDLVLNEVLPQLERLGMTVPAVRESRPA